MQDQRIESRNNYALLSDFLIITKPAVILSINKREDVATLREIESFPIYNYVGIWQQSRPWEDAFLTSKVEWEVIGEVSVIKFYLVVKNNPLCRFGWNLG